MTDAHPTSETKKCSKKKCKRQIPINSTHTTCQTCREINQRSRQKQNGWSHPGASSTGLQKRQRDSASDSERPLQRLRTEDEEKQQDMTEVDYATSEELFQQLRSQLQTSDDVDFKGSYLMAISPDMSPKDRVQSVVREVWRLTGYRFTVHDNKGSDNWHTTRYWCSQDEAHKKKYQPSSAPGAKLRDNVGMMRYPCKSCLTIIYRVVRHSTETARIRINLHHHFRHVLYVDVSMLLEARAIIEERAQWAKPSDLASHISGVFPQVTAAQVYNYWHEISVAHWRQDNDQIISATKLLQEYSDEIDIFDLTGLPDGVTAVAWGMKKVAKPLENRIVEIGLDATYNTNSQHLELYSIMAEHDNAGFPLSYCLLTTATAIELGKRKRALECFIG
ncbi:hypothetical protein CVT24_002829 [Panaeolus cyanescens]|uniref:Uncharacterized protein n=1 Tax=Panaeolus cyanescens TaxID=181874 RepID=A0A409YY58_9AGAR|nr:hypothetical protein CVT24_002829 [Panaeolus cyanescens]